MSALVLRADLGRVFPAAQPPHWGRGRRVITYLESYLEALLRAPPGWTANVHGPAKSRDAPGLGLLACGARPASERVYARSPDGRCELLGLGGEDALGELDGLVLDPASATGDQGLQDSRFALVGEAFGSLIGLPGETARSWSSPTRSESLCALSARVFIIFGATGLRIWAACQRSLERLRSSWRFSSVGSLRAVRKRAAGSAVDALETGCERGHRVVAEVPGGDPRARGAQLGDDWRSGRCILAQMLLGRLIVVNQRRT